MESKKRVLVVDDFLVDRLILEKILKDDYIVVQAENGQQALDILARSLQAPDESNDYDQTQGPIAGVVLDLVMPVMDGYTVLETMKSTADYSNIPVVVSTGDGGNEMHALEVGAWDFITKPYDPTILKFRLRNVIERSQLSAFEQLKYVTNFDTLTGIYRKPKFQEETRAMLNANHDKKFALIRFDIDRFQLINSFFGHEEGDQLLRFIADTLRTGLAPFENCTYGRIDSDVFAVCLQYVNRGDVFDFIAAEGERVRAFKKSFDVLAVFGVFFVEDKTLSISTMLDRATLAAKSCKGNFTKPFAEYDASMSRSLADEQEVLNEVHQALDEHQFVVFYQPKYDLFTKRPVGAEALARWMHPQKGLVSPAVFIPVCEKNGLVSQVDHCIWTEVCKQLRTWIDEGINPLPISVNMSLVNLYNPNIVNEVCEIAAEYGIERTLLQIEMTESAYMDNPGIMKRVVNGFHDAGFQVHMDDFGSGYSSLSILKDIDVDLLKIDMRFLSSEGPSGRGESILAAVVRMAKWLGIPTITEGVEDTHQIDFLKSVGCEYAQGFYFSRPVPADEFESILRNNTPAPLSEHTTTISALWNANSEFEAKFAKDAAPLCIIEMSNGSIDVVRANDAFCDLLEQREDLFNGAFTLVFDESSSEAITAAILQATEQPETATCDVRTKAGAALTLCFTTVGHVSTTWVLSCVPIARCDASRAE